jgi:hypothetical protein
MKLILIKIPAIVAVALAVVSSAGAALAKDDARLERCRKLYDLLTRYQIESVPHHNSGARFRADVSEALCEAGDYERGLDGLETEMRRAGLPLPPQN